MKKIFYCFSPCAEIGKDWVMGDAPSKCAQTISNLLEFAVLHSFHQFLPQKYLHTGICKVKFYICWSNLHIS